MKPNMNTMLLILTCIPLGLGGCKENGMTTANLDDAMTPDSGEGQGEDAREEVRIAIPDAVQQNLGIRFVEVQERRVEQTLRVPGRFEYLPTARREYRLPVAGRVELLVEQFDRVKEGDILCRIDSLQWRELQQSLAVLGATIGRLELELRNYEPLLAAHELHEASLQNSIDVLEERVVQLKSVRDAGGGRVSEFSQARSSLAMAQAELASLEEKHVELRIGLDQAVQDLESARAREGFLLGSVSTITGIEREKLLETTELDGRSVAFWARIDAIEMRATRAGIVESLELTNGAWAEQRTAVLRVVRPEMLRFHASGLQSDLGMLRDGLVARIVPPTLSTSAQGIEIGAGIDGTLTLGLGGDPDERTVDLYVVPEKLEAWARHGVSAQLEIVTDSSAQAMASVPLGAIQRDGLVSVVFQRDPFDPRQAIRREVALGRDDGRWVEVLDGVDLGNEIVLDGAFQLLLASSSGSGMQKGGHFHADGTFHEGED